MKDEKMIAPFRPTKDQRKWVDDESDRTGSNIATVLRGLIQAKIDKVKK